MRRILFLLLLLAGLLISSAAAAQTFEENYDTEFNKLKDDRDYLYRDGDTIQWQIVNFNPESEYYVRVYSYRHISLLQEIPLKVDGIKSGERITGSFSLELKNPGVIHLNLQQHNTKDRPQIKKNLDIITISETSKTEFPSDYIKKVQYWTRAITDKINGASFSAVSILTSGGG